MSNSCGNHSACLFSTIVQFVADEEPIVADSCIVALDMLEFEQSGELHYADEGLATAASS